MFSKKIFVLDTNVLIISPYAIFDFDKDDTIIIPAEVISELDNVKEEWGAREAKRNLEELRTKGDLRTGIKLPTGATLRVHVSQDSTEETLTKRVYADPAVIKAAMDISKENPDAEVTIISNDINIRMVADLLSNQTVKSRSYISDDILSDLVYYSGRRTIQLPDHILTAIAESKGKYGVALPKDIKFDDGALIENEYLVMQNYNGDSSQLGRVSKGEIWAINTNVYPYGQKPRNVGQRFAVNALMLPVEEAPLCIIQGSAGTAKTFLSLACGLEQTIGANSLYKKVLVVRPNIKFDETLGFLKGGEAEKIGPLIRPILDNLDQLTSSRADNSYYGYNKNPSYSNKGKKGRRATDFTDNESHDKITAPNSYAQELFDTGILEAQAMEYMRGRSITNTYIIIDEAQNMTPHQAFGIISRAGVGTKVVLVGDPEQIDNPSLDRLSNGLSWAASKMKDDPLCVQLKFKEEECSRSVLAKAAITKLGIKGKE